MIATLAAALPLALPALAPPPAPAPAPALQGRGAPSQDEELPPIQQEGDFFILNFAETAEDGLNLLQFVKLCQEATGRNFIVVDEAESALQQQRVRMFGTKRIPREDFYGFFQIVMFIHDFATVDVGPKHMSVTVIQSLTSTARGGPQNIKQKAEYVLPEELESYANQPAVLITTVITLPNTDVRQLTTSLRGLITDNQTQNMLNAGNSNAVVLTGFGSHIAALAKLLYIIDEASAVDELPTPVFQIIPIEYASAEEIADLVDQLLEAQNEQIRNLGPRQPTAEGGVARGRQNLEAKILTDARTNSLIVMALAEDMPRIQDLVAQLDVDVVEPERNFHIYSLENVQASDLAETLDDFLQDAERIATSSATATGGRSSTSTTPSSSRNQNEVVVVPDPNTNSLLIAASKTRYQEVLELVRQLDRRQDQVLIETALIELTGSDFRDLGVELGAADTQGDGGFGVTLFGLSTIDFQGGDNGQTPVKVPNQANGITAGILDGNDFSLPFLLRFFQSRNDANVLNVPSVLVNNNGSARVEIIDSFPTTQVTATGGVGGQTQTNFEQFVDAGITLEISPSISASRYLRLNLTLNVSNFTGTVSGSIPPPKTTRVITTTINVPDGDTMVIGGIITDTKRNTRESVPFLGDLPLLGALFRRDSDTNDRITLYFFVTPHILHDRDFADLAEISYKKKLQAAEIIGRDRMRVIDPGFEGDEEGISLEPFEVPLYQSPARGEVDSDSVGLDPERRAELMRVNDEAAEASQDMEQAGSSNP